MSGQSLRTRAWLVALVLLAFACADSEIPATQVLVTVYASPATARELKSISAFVYEADAVDESRPTEARHFPVTQVDAGVGVEWVNLLSFGVVKGRADRFKLVVKGYDSDEQVSAMIEQKALASYQKQEKRPVAMLLADRCWRRAAQCSGLDRTCRWDTPDSELAGEVCGPVLEAASQPPSVAAPTTAPITTMEPSVSGNSGESGAPSAQPVCPIPNGCTATDYPCAAGPDGYTCVGQYADWPMPIDDAGRATENSVKYDYETTQGVVADKVTGLSWQRVLPSVYPGCSGMSMGQAAWMGDACSWEQAKSYCSQLTLAGLKWRLPSKIELESLGVDPLATGSDASWGLDTRAFSPYVPIPRPQVYWSSSSATQFVGRAWLVAYGGTTFSATESTSRPLQVRCVSGTPTGRGTPADRYVVNGDAVTDTRTGLVWQRRVLFGAFSISTAPLTFCEGLGWRVPTRNELLTLVDPTRRAPAIDPVFTDTVSTKYWSSSEAPAPTASNTLCSWTVDFLDGATHVNCVGADALVRCVR